MRIFPTSILILSLLLCGVRLQGQTYFNPQTPISESGFKQRNYEIAKGFGPAIYQWVGTCKADADDGDADRILKGAVAI